MSEKSYNTFTGTFAPGSEAAAGETLGSLIETQNKHEKTPKRLENGEFINRGTTTLSIAILQDGHAGTAAAANFVTLPAGENMVFERINVDYVRIKTSDDAGSNILEVLGTPVQI